jgi:hypothetical protein
MSEEKMMAGVLEAMRRGWNTASDCIRLSKTGLMLSLHNRANYRPEMVAEWEAAIDEYFEMEKRSKDDPQSQMMGKFPPEKPVTVWENLLPHWCLIR